MRFFDCNTFLGAPAADANCPGVTADQLVAEMDRAGIHQALVWHVAQLDHDPLVGNELLAEAIKPHDRLVGCWALLPPQTGELGDLSDWFGRAAKANVMALRAFPAAHNYLLRWEVVGELIEAMVELRMPLLASVTRGVTWEQIYSLLSEFPELRLVICDAGCWGRDRFFRPLVERYPNVSVDISAYLLDGGIEDFVARCGARRLLFGTNFPAASHGGMMLALARAEISDMDKDAIAGGNLEQLLSEVKL